MANSHTGGDPMDQNQILEMWRKEIERLLKEKQWTIGTDEDYDRIMDGDPIRNKKGNDVFITALENGSAMIIQLFFEDGMYNEYVNSRGETVIEQPKSTYYSGPVAIKYYPRSDGSLAMSQQYLLNDHTEKRYFYEGFK